MPIESYDQYSLMDSDIHGGQVSLMREGEFSTPTRYGVCMVGQSIQIMKEPVALYAIWQELGWQYHTGEDNAAQ